MIDICAEKQCVGCEVCRNICPKNAIKFAPDSEGFFYPVIDQRLCVECNLCRKVCPANSTPAYHPEQSSVYAAYALDDSIRQSSSSGGLYSVFANYCFSQGGVANGVYFNEEHFFVHGLFDNAESILPCRGSKYVQSQPGLIYQAVKQALEANRMVLFTSTPCQVNALYKYLGKDYENLYTCDFVCHGVPSPHYFIRCLQRITGGDKAVSHVTFRNLSGWGDFGIKIKGCNKEYFFSENAIKHSYIKTFLAGADYRYSCYDCKFSSGHRVSDITLGDFWGLGKYKPFWYDTSKGISLLIVNTEKGQNLLDKVQDQLFLEKRSVREAARENHQLRQCVTMPASRAEFYSDVQILSDSELLKKYIPQMPLWKKIVNFPLRVINKLIRVGIKICCNLFRSLQ